MFKSAACDRLSIKKGEWFYNCYSTQVLISLDGHFNVFTL